MNDRFLTITLQPDWKAALRGAAKMAAKVEGMTIKHDDWLLEQLKDAEFAAEFLNAAKEDDDPNTYGTAFQKVAQARLHRLALSREYGEGAHRKP